MGPFQFNDRTSWTGFQKQVRRTAYITEEQMVLSGMTWHTNKWANSTLPLTDSAGYWTMIQQILNLKDPSSAILIVGHPIPKENVPDRGFQ